MASRFQAVALVSSPTYSNAVAWSNENLVAVASGHFVTIMNPAMPFGPKGLITIPDNKPFPIGVIERKDVASGFMLPTCLSRDVRPCVRSISWSPLGLAPNAGCLLAVCTTKGVVKVYRSPFREFSAEWVEVMDVSEMLHTYFAKIGYAEAHVASPEDCEATQVGSEQDDSDDDDAPIAHIGIRNKSRRQKNRPFITAEQYARRSAMLSSLVVAWSPMLDRKSSRNFCVLAVGAKSGKISFWRVDGPQRYSITQGSSPPPVALLIGSIQAHDSWITAIGFSKFVSDGSPQLLISTGSSDGSVKLWRGYIDDMLKSTEDSHASFSLLKEVSILY
ncbi:putative transcription factor WD40-like family [Helianthus annuus]|nr:putative transcription factor WD40-like family [Helianthus annuus]